MPWERQTASHMPSARGSRPVRGRRVARSRSCRPDSRITRFPTEPEVRPGSIYPDRRGHDLSAILNHRIDLRHRQSWRWLDDPEPEGDLLGEARLADRFGVCGISRASRPGPQPPTSGPPRPTSSRPTSKVRSGEPGSSAVGGENPSHRGHSEQGARVGNAADDFSVILCVLLDSRGRFQVVVALPVWAPCSTIRLSPSWSASRWALSSVRMPESSRVLSTSPIDWNA
ncbi:hypothetical protein BH23PLA1_BH23PLA1_27290 [soil metagenome]